MQFIYQHGRKAVIFLFFLGITAILMRPGSSVASDQATIEGAKKEGKLSLYTSMNVTDANTMIQHFKKKYPFLEVVFIRSSSEPLLNRLEQETAVKRYNADAITATFGIWNTMVNKGMLMKYKSPESAVYPPRMTHPESLWTVMYLQVYSIAYNATLVAKDVAPRRYADLLHPRWRGKKIGLDYNDQNWEDRERI